MFKKSIAIIVIAFLSSCAAQHGNIQQDITAVYNRAVADAAVAEQAEIRATGYLPSIQRIKH